MKLQKTTWILLIVAIILGGFVYFYEVIGSEKRAEIQEEKRKIFAFDKEQIQSFTIEKNSEILEFERTEDELNPWQMKQPENVPASDAAVSFLLDLIAEGKSEKVFSVSTNELQNYGLNRPFATVNIQLKNNESHQIILGNPNFDNKFLYAQTDPQSNSEEESEVLLVPIDFQYGVERELSEWKQESEIPEEDFEEDLEEAN
ncbi:MAG: DUF4340 domain-containing protein [Oscillatoria sp. PMC 1068.18]|nr:DUF4340 domain-containing protein [Oscillatoria sp. PMC 1076.18]MEC4989857.1 DUF4340 domain-containing protein [Oscillatoria sp. PMC 1068.18]